MTRRFTVEQICQQCKVAEEELLHVISIHANWRVATLDEDIFGQFDGTYAAHTFKAVRVALRREVIMGLSRIWDTRHDTINFLKIAQSLRDQTTHDAIMLGNYRDRANDPEFRKACVTKRDEVCNTIERLLARIRPEMMRRVRQIRDTHLAHRGVQERRQTAPVQGATYDDRAVDWLYVQSIKVVELLFEVVFARGSSFATASGVDEYYARHFWRSFYIEGSGARMRRVSRPPL